jgi:hypothetical protein
MDLQTLVGRIRKTLGEVEPSGYNSQTVGEGSWDNSQIIGYINEALGLMAEPWRKEKVGSIAVTTIAQTDFTFPADMLEGGLRKVLYTSSGMNYPIKYIDLDTYMERAQSIAISNVGNSVYTYCYTIWGGLIKLFPGAAAMSDTITPYYYRVPLTLAAPTDTPEIPSRYHIALVHYGVMECQNAVEEVGLESDAEQKWLQELNMFRIAMSKNQRDQGIRARGRR